MEISVVIPAYNEAQNITATLSEVVDYLAKRFNQWEVIVVDDGSKDATCRLVETFAKNAGSKNYQVQLLKNERNLGKGAAVRKGMLFAKGKLRLFMDADNATKIDELDNFLPFFAERIDIAIGSRKLKDSLVIEGQPFMRRLASFVYHWLVKLILGTEVSDYNCGFKAFRGKVAERIFSLQRTERWEFDAEISFLAKQMGYAVQEIPIAWQHKATSKVRAGHAALTSLLGIFKIRMYHLRGLYL
jgi:dolichyl-phosphate beta-glucosyltransferase